MVGSSARQRGAAADLDVLPGDGRGHGRQQVAHEARDLVGPDQPADRWHDGLCRGTRTLIDTELREGRLVEAGAPHWAIDVEIRLFRRQASELRVAEAL